MRLLLAIATKNSIPQHHAKVLRARGVPCTPQVLAAMYN